MPPTNTLNGAVAHQPPVRTAPQTAPQQTIVVGYYNNTTHPIEIDIREINRRLYLKPGEWVMDQAGRVVNDPLLDKYVHREALTKASKPGEWRTLVSLVRAGTPVQSPVSTNPVSATMTMMRGPAGNQPYYQPQAAIAPPPGKSFFGCSMEEARRHRLVRPVAVRDGLSVIGEASEKDEGPVPNLLTPGNEMPLLAQSYREGERAVRRAPVAPVTQRPQLQAPPAPTRPLPPPSISQVPQIPSIPPMNTTPTPMVPIVPEVEQPQAGGYVIETEITQQVVPPPPSVPDLGAGGPVDPASFLASIAPVVPEESEEPLPAQAPAPPPVAPLTGAAARLAPPTPAPRPFVCAADGKAFTARKYLVRHVRANFPDREAELTAAYPSSATAKQ